MSPADVGQALRRMRRERQLSLTAAAERVGTSAATLSRVETGKQSLDVGLMLALVRVLGATPADIFCLEHGAEGPKALTRRLARLGATERTKLLLDASRGSAPRETRAAVDDLVSAVDLLREEILAVRRRLRRGSGIGQRRG